MKMALYGLFSCAVLLCLFYVARANELPEAVTAWPEICRVMGLYRSCDDVTYRIACPTACPDVALSCTARNMIYIPSKGKCYGITKEGLFLWAYAMTACLAYSSKLAVLKDESDAEVFTYLNNEIGGSRNKFLVGAVSIGKDQAWVNVDGTVVDNNFWVNSKPSSSEAQCMYSQKNSEFKKNYDSCNNNEGFICADDD